MTFSPEIIDKSSELIKILAKKNKKIVAAESCTAGLFAAAITEISGASEVFERGYITYSNASKIDLLTVPTFYIDEYGAVSLETAVAMAEGALLMSRADVSVAITGIAGPDGGSEQKPVGTVFIASAMKGKDTICEQFLFSGSRSQIRSEAVKAAMDMVIKRLDLLAK